MYMDIYSQLAYFVLHFPSHPHSTFFIICLTTDTRDHVNERNKIQI